MTAYTKLLSLIFVLPFFSVCCCVVFHVVVCLVCFVLNAFFGLLFVVVVCLFGVFVCLANSIVSIV